MDIGQRLLSLLKSHSMTQKTLSLRADLTSSYVNQICTGKKVPTIDTLEKICTVFSISLEDFFSCGASGKALPLDPSEHRLISCFRNLAPHEKAGLLALAHTLSDHHTVNNSSPEINRQVDGYAAAGLPFFDTADYDSCVSVPPKYLDSDRFLIIEARGDSMEPEIFNGDYVVVAHNVAPSQGEIALVSIEGDVLDDEFTIKRFYRFADHIELRSLNPNYPPLSYPSQAFRSAQKVVHIIHTNG